MAMKLDNRAAIRFDTYGLLSRAVEEGVESGIRRAYKHTDKPVTADVVENIVNAVMNSLCGILSFEEVSRD